MRIIEKLAASGPAFSFEYFPPKDEEGYAALFETIRRLEQYHPAFVSVTYGAGGSTRGLTLELVRRIQAETGIEAMAHLTCVGATRAGLSETLDQYRAAGIDNVLALRGDPPRGERRLPHSEPEYCHANELVEFIRGRYDFCVAGACYPEKHPEAPDLSTDLAHLKRKVDAGVDFLITQLFFENRDYFAFVEQARAFGIEVPILAGIMPITGLSQIKRFTAMCGARIPDRLLARLEGTGGDPVRVQAIGVAHAVEQCRELLAAGVPGIHFYTLNRSPATVYVLEAVR
jgi:methylenetetrahydrofolate reductase (NADPH)